MSWDAPDGWVAPPYVPPTDWWEVLALNLSIVAIHTVIDG